MYSLNIVFLFERRGSHGVAHVTVLYLLSAGFFSNSGMFMIPPSQHLFLKNSLILSILIPLSRSLRSLPVLEESEQDKKEGNWHFLGRIAIHSHQMFYTPVICKRAVTLQRIAPTYADV